MTIIPWRSNKILYQSTENHYIFPVCVLENIKEKKQFSEDYISIIHDRYLWRFQFIAYLFVTDRVFLAREVHPVFHKWFIYAALPRLFLVHAFARDFIKTQITLKKSETNTLGSFNGTVTDGSSGSCVGGPKCIHFRYRWIFFVGGGRESTIFNLINI